MTSTMTVVSVQTFTVTRQASAVQSPAPQPPKSSPKPQPGKPSNGGVVNTPTGNSLPGVCSGNQILCTGGGYTFSACGQNGQVRPSDCSLRLTLAVHQHGPCRRRNAVHQRADRLRHWQCVRICSPAVADRNSVRQQQAAPQHARPPAKQLQRSVPSAPSPSLIARAGRLVRVMHKRQTH